MKMPSRCWVRFRLWLANRNIRTLGNAYARGDGDMGIYGGLLQQACFLQTRLTVIDIYLSRRKARKERRHD